METCDKFAGYPLLAKSLLATKEGCRNFQPQISPEEEKQWRIENPRRDSGGLKIHRDGLIEMVQPMRRCLPSPSFFIRYKALTLYYLSTAQKVGHILYPYVCTLLG
jgi:hypothetical protein